MKLPQIILLFDDAIAFIVITLVGINMHQTDPSLFARLPFTLLPFLATWIFFAATLQLYDPITALAWPQLWRIPVASALTAPTGAVIRAIWLGSSLVPIFVLVMGTAIAVGILVSRSIFILILGKRWSVSDHG